MDNSALPSFEFSSVHVALSAVRARYHARTQTPRSPTEGEVHAGLKAKWSHYSVDESSLDSELVGATIVQASSSHCHGSFRGDGGGVSMAKAEISQSFDAASFELSSGSLLETSNSLRSGPPCAGATTCTSDTSSCEAASCVGSCSATFEKGSVRTCLSEPVKADSRLDSCGTSGSTTDGSRKPSSGSSGSCTGKDCGELAS
mmetsp:Transcript_66331/g.175674  ORF Transcript_66331/g.175674 Transcript_66331/m.175674 type:complete len:202 (-) Transcript_66331:873-1478(-)